MAGNQPVTGGPAIQPGSPPPGSSIPHADPGQRPTPQTQGPYINTNAPKQDGYQYTGPGDKESSNQANQHLNDNRQQNGDPNGRIGASGGGYTVSLGDLKKISDQVHGMITAADKDLQDAKDVAGASPSAKDADGSVMYATGLTQWGQDLIQELTQYRTALVSYKGHLDAVAKNYGKMDADTSVTFKDFQGEL